MRKKEHLFSREHIINEIKRTAAENGGTPLGELRLAKETGIKKHDWDRYWNRLGEAQAEAGLQPNDFQRRIPDEELLNHLALLAQRLKSFPIEPDIRRESRENPNFPSSFTFNRLGNKHERVSLLREHCIKRGYKDVVKYCDDALSKLQKPGRTKNGSASDESESSIGYVYLMKSGKYYKIGRTNSVGRRERELSIQLPEKVLEIHSIKTDDPVGIEKYWHDRFSDRRKNGEWFELTAQDVAAFKRRKFM